MRFMAGLISLYHSKCVEPKKADCTPRLHTTTAYRLNTMLIAGTVKTRQRIIDKAPVLVLMSIEARSLTFKKALHSKRILLLWGCS